MEPQQKTTSAHGNQQSRRRSPWNHKTSKGTTGEKRPRTRPNITSAPSQQTIPKLVEGFEGFSSSAPFSITGDALLIKTFNSDPHTQVPRFALVVTIMQGSSARKTKGCSDWPPGWQALRGTAQYFLVSLDSAQEWPDSLKVAACQFDSEATAVILLNPALFKGVMDKLANKCYTKLCGDGSGEAGKASRGAESLVFATQGRRNVRKHMRMEAVAWVQRFCPTTW